MELPCNAATYTHSGTGTIPLYCKGVLHARRRSLLCDPPAVFNLTLADRINCL